MPKLRHAIEIGEGTAYLIGNATLIGQGVAGAYSTTEGLCAVWDGTLCPVPGVAMVYYTGGACQITSGIALMASSVVGSICPAAGAIGATLGFGLRKFGNYVIDSANTVNPVPTVTKVV